ncbi:MAG: sodium:calcium antiporter, partial [Firmicutes bacterium]|nr:sodium:calcium antiporter [Bacillota bacterium]
GSNIMNILVILGLASVITVIAVSKTTVHYEIPFMLAITAVFTYLGYADGEIGFMDGIILWGCFIAYLSYMFVMCNKGLMQTEEVIVSGSFPMLIIKGIIGMGLIIFGSDITVDAATELAKIFGMSERLIGLTIVAFGTSLPELVTSVVAARRGKADIAIGNIVGSNIFNILFVVGTSALIIPIVFAEKFLFDCMIAFGAGVLLWICIARKKELNRVGGLVLLICYGAYFGYLMVQ